MVTGLPDHQTSKMPLVEPDEAQRRRQIEENQRLIAALRAWREDDDPGSLEEQRETFAYLRQALDEGRTNRKLFP